MSRDRKNPNRTRLTALPSSKPPVERCVFCGRAADEVDELFPTETGQICAKCIYHIARQIKADHKGNLQETQHRR